MPDRGVGLLTTETIQGAALALQRIDNIHRRHSLATGMLRVRHRVADHVLEEHLEHTTGLLVDEAADALHATTTSQTADSRLRNALDIVPKDLAMALRAALAQTFTTFATSRHFLLRDYGEMNLKAAASTI